MHITLDGNNYSINYAAHTLNKGRRNNNINKKAVLAAATIVLSLSVSAGSILTAENVPVAQITEEEEKRPVTLYFSSNGDGEYDNATAAAEDEASIPAFSGEKPITSGSLPDTADIDVQGKEQASLSIIDKKYTVKKTVISARKHKNYTKAEKKMIAKVVYAEARGEFFDGKVAVAQVVINRYESGKFGKSLKRIVYGKGQFAVSGRYTNACMRAVEYAIQNRPYPKNMYFFQVSKRKHWRNFVYYHRIGHHSFYCGKK